MDYIDREDPQILGRYEAIQMHQNGMGYGISRLYDGMEQIVTALTQIITSAALAFGMFTLPVFSKEMQWLNTWWFNLLAALLIVISVLFSAYVGKKTAIIYAGSSDMNNDGNRYFSFCSGELKELSR